MLLDVAVCCHLLTQIQPSQTDVALFLFLSWEGVIFYSGVRCGSRWAGLPECSRSSQALGSISAAQSRFLVNWGWVLGCRGLTMAHQPGATQVSNLSPPANSFWRLLMCLDISWLFLARVLFYFYFLVSGYVRLRYGLMAWNANAHQGSTVYIKTSPVDASMDNIYFCATCANFAKACRTTARYSKLKYAETCWNMLKCIELRRVISRSWMLMIVHVSWYFLWSVST